MAVTYRDYWFGLQPPETAIAAWGARAIISRHFLDVVHNRRQCDDGCTWENGNATNPLHQELHVGLDQLTPEIDRRIKAADPDLDQRSDAVTTLTHGRVTLRCSPNASYGYLYLVAYIEGPTDGEVDAPA